MDAIREKEKLRRKLRLRTTAVLHNVDLENAHILLAYLPLASEVDVLPVIDRAMEAGLVVAVPSAVPMEFVILAENWRHHLFRLPNGTLCPHGPVLDIRTIDAPCLMLVPGVAFTPQGDRLGRGGGFYDRVLAAASRCVRTVGVCRKDALLAALPLEKHDVPVSGIIVC